MKRSRGSRWRGAELHARPASGRPRALDQVLQMLADRLRVAEVVVLLDQALNSGSSAVRRTGTELERAARSTAPGPACDRSPPGPAARCASGLGGSVADGGSSISPRGAAAAAPRHTMSRGGRWAAPTATPHTASRDSRRRLSPGCSAMNSRMKSISSCAVMTRPRYLHPAGTPSLWQNGKWNARTPAGSSFFTRSHAATPARLRYPDCPPASSNCA